MHSRLWIEIVDHRELLIRIDDATWWESRRICGIGSETIASGEDGACAWVTFRSRLRWRLVFRLQELCDCQ